MKPSLTAMGMEACTRSRIVISVWFRALFSRSQASQYTCSGVGKKWSSPLEQLNSQSLVMLLLVLVTRVDARSDIVRGSALIS
jgi:hypothetical protein